MDARRRDGVLFDDGTVASLPSVFPLREPLPPAVRVLACTNVDGLDLCVTRAGLYTQAPNPDGGAIGVWQKVTLPPSSTWPVDAGGDFTGSVLLVEGTHQAWLLNSWGTTYRLTVDGGKP